MRDNDIRSSRWLVQKSAYQRTLTRTNSVTGDAILRSHHRRFIKDLPMSFWHDLTFDTCRSATLAATMRRLTTRIKKDWIPMNDVTDPTLSIPARPLFPTPTQSPAPALPPSILAGSGISH